MGGVEDENVPFLCRVVWDFLNIFRHCLFQVMLKMRCTVIKKRRTRSANNRTDQGV